MARFSLANWFNLDTYSIFFCCSFIFVFYKYNIVIASGFACLSEHLIIVGALALSEKRSQVMGVLGVGYNAHQSLC